VTAPATTPANRPAWAPVLQRPAEEFSAAELPVLAGRLPSDLRGTLYRNGPGRLQRGPDRVGHWFDGDGAVLAAHFTGDRVTATYRYVRTRGLADEAEAGRLRYGNYGMVAPGPFWNHWRYTLKNAANTSVLALPDRVLALWEGGNPHALDRTTLETLGTDQLGALGNGDTYSAHPKRDPQTGEIFGFGVAISKDTTLNLYRSHPDGTIAQRGSVPLPGVPLVHDGAIAGRYWVFFVPPVRVNVWPVLLGLSSYCDAMSWQPHLGTEVIVIDRDSLEVVCRTTAEPWFQWHFANGCETPDGEIQIDFARYPDFATNQFLREVPSGSIQTPARATLCRTRIDPQTGSMRAETLLARGCEFPVTAASEVGQPWRATYLSVHRDAAENRDLFGAIARFDAETRSLAIADAGPQRYPSEPIHAPAGWVLAVVYDGARDRSEIWIYPEDFGSGEPVCRLGLPQPIPHSFHGTWVSA